MAMAPHNYSFLPADTSLSPAFSIVVSVVATTAFPPAGRVRRYIVLATGLVCPGPQLLPGLLQWTCAQLPLGPEPRAFSRDPESPGRWRVVWTSLSHKTMLGLHEKLVINGSAQSNLFQNAHVIACGSLSNQLPNGSFFSLEEQVCIYLISISIGRYPGLDPPILSVSLL